MKIPLQMSVIFYDIKNTRFHAVRNTYHNMKEVLYYYATLITKELGQKWQSANPFLTVTQLKTVQRRCI